MTVSLSQAANHNGWYNHAVDYSVTARERRDLRDRQLQPTSNLQRPGRCKRFSHPHVHGQRWQYQLRFRVLQVRRNGTDQRHNDANEPADHNGWYNNSSGCTTTGSDVTSGNTNYDSGT